MKKFILTILSVLIAAATLFTACAKPTTDSDVSTGSSADESSVESQISSEDSTDSSEETTDDTSDVVAAVTPSKPDDTSAESKSEASEAPVSSEAPIINTPVESTTDPVESKAPTEDNTSEEHVHSYKFSYTESRNATCTEDGINVYKCTCGDSYTEPSGDKATGHAWTTWVDDNENRTATRTCQFSRCKQTETKALADLFIIKETDIDAICDRILELLNEERAKLGAPALSTAPIAHEMAMVRAEQLTTLFSHKMPDGRDGALIYRDYQYNLDDTPPANINLDEHLHYMCYMPFSSSEDILKAGGSYNNDTVEDWADLVICCFKTSAGHWADLMNPEYTGVGIGFTFVIESSYKITSYTSILTMDKTYG